MSKPFKNLLKKMTPERRERIKKLTMQIKEEMALGELRRALDLTQEDVARSLKVKQAAISKIENQSDLYIRTLRKFLHAMGAELKIVAQFPNTEVIIDQFTEIHQKASAVHKSHP